MFAYPAEHLNRLFTPTPSLSSQRVSRKTIAMPITTPSQRIPSRKTNGLPMREPAMPTHPQKQQHYHRHDDHEAQDREAERPAVLAFFLLLALQPGVSEGAC